MAKAKRGARLISIEEREQMRRKQGGAPEASKAANEAASRVSDKAADACAGKTSSASRRAKTSAAPPILPEHSLADEIGGALPILILPDEAEQAAFAAACELVVNQPRDEHDIGRLKEKSIHAVLKQYYAPNPLLHEQRVGSFVADIKTGSHIIEIQTRQFRLLRRKLEAFLPDYHVTIVYPVAYKKQLRWIDKETGEISPPRKSTRRGSPYQIVPELYQIKPFLTHPNLSISIAMLEVEEYRMLDGWGRNGKRGASRNDGIPTLLSGLILLEQPSDYLQLLPAIPQPFTVPELQAALSIPRNFASILLHILNELQVVCRVGKRGNAFLYEVRR